MNRQDIEKLIDVIDKNILSYNEDNQYFLLKNGCEHKIPIEYQNQREGIKIDSNHENIIIFKDEKDVISRITKDCLEKHIAVVGKKLIYQHNNEKSTFDVIEKLKCCWELFDLLENDITDYHDKLNKKFILITNKGIDHIGYKNKNDVNLKDEHNIKVIDDIKKQLEKDKSFLSFLKSNIIKNLSNEEPENRFYKLQKQLTLIFRNSKRDFNLYKSKF